MQAVLRWAALFLVGLGTVLGVYVAADALLGPAPVAVIDLSGQVSLLRCSPAGRWVLMETRLAGAERFNRLLFDRTSNQLYWLARDVPELWADAVFLEEAELRACAMPVLHPGSSAAVRVESLSLPLGTVRILHQFQAWSLPPELRLAGRRVDAVVREGGQTYVTAYDLEEQRYVLRHFLGEGGGPGTPLVVQADVSDSGKTFFCLLNLGRREGYESILGLGAEAKPKEKKVAREPLFGKFLPGRDQMVLQKRGEPARIIDCATLEVKHRMHPSFDLEKDRHRLAEQPEDWGRFRVAIPSAVELHNVFQGRASETILVAGEFPVAELPLPEVGAIALASFSHTEPAMNDWFTWLGLGHWREAGNYVTQAFELKDLASQETMMMRTETIKQSGGAAPNPFQFAADRSGRSLVLAYPERAGQTRVEVWDLPMEPYRGYAGVFVAALFGVLLLCGAAAFWPRRRSVRPVAALRDYGEVLPPA